MSAERLVAAFASLLLAGAALADVFLTGDIRLAQGETPDSYELGAILPGGVAGDDAVAWPAGCTQTGFQRAAMGDRELLSYRADCARPPGRQDYIVTRWKLDAASFNSGPDSGSPALTLLPVAAGIRIPFHPGASGDRGWREIAPEMLQQGLLHIWRGWDHLAFVLCLCMLARGLALLGLVTAFTLGHSLSLGLAFFGLLRIPVAPTEAVIALSIVLVAREALIAGLSAPDRHSLARMTAIVTGFGLVHGLGFASALEQLGISAGERWPALVFFNLGVELGQVAFVAAVVGTIAALRRISLDGTARRLALHAAGTVGGFWLVERIAGF